MDKLISYLYNQREKGIKILLYLCDAFVSVLSILLIPNKLLSILFVIGIFLINFIINIAENLKIYKLLDRKTKNVFLFILFTFALLPLGVGVIKEGADFGVLFFSNTIPNLLGATTVLSLINHISKFKYSDFVAKILQTDYIMNSLLKIFYYFCYFNSVSFFIDKNQKYTNFFNNIYLFVVILSGLIVGSAFYYRIFIDDRPFDFSPKKVFPTATLYCGAAFLISCTVPSYFAKVEIAPILLILNSMTAFIAALVLFYFVIRKSEKCPSEYPFFHFGVFTIVIFLNCCLYIVHNVENAGNIPYQLVTGGGILTAVVLGLYITNKKIKEKNGSEEDRRDIDFSKK